MEKKKRKATPGSFKKGHVVSLEMRRKLSIAHKKRDKWGCKIKSKDCNDRLEAHHILNWMAYPELRYDINNGITLCQFHHPRKRVEEQRLIPFFQSMVEVK